MGVIYIGYIDKYKSERVMMLACVIGPWHSALRRSGPCGPWWLDEPCDTPAIPTRKSYPSSTRFVVHISSSVGDSCYDYNYIRDSAARGRQAYTYTQQHALGAGGAMIEYPRVTIQRERMGSLTDSQTSIDVFFSTIDQIKHPFEP